MSVPMQAAILLMSFLLAQSISAALGILALVLYPAIATAISLPLFEVTRAISQSFITVGLTIVIDTLMYVQLVNYFAYVYQPDPLPAIRLSEINHKISKTMGLRLINDCRKSIMQLLIILAIPIICYCISFIIVDTAAVVLRHSSNVTLK